MISTIKDILRLGLTVILLTTAISCTSSVEETQPEVKHLVAKVIHSHGETMVVVANNDTISLSRTCGANCKYTDVPLGQDSVVLYYVMDNSGKMHVKDVIVLNHNEPVLNNVTAMLIGTWELDNEESNIKEVSFDETLKAQMVTKAGKMLDISWLIKGKNIVYGSGIKSNIDQYQIVRVDANSLTISDNRSVYTLKRLYN